MHKKTVSPAVLAAVLSACALEPESLNSERIEKRFGSYGIEVLSQKSGIRRSILYSIEAGRRIGRTYAVVRFMNMDSDAVADVHAGVLAGASIGAAFKETGFRIGKETLHTGSLSVPAGEHVISELMQIEGHAWLAMHVYRLVLIEDERPMHYATIVEVHHPEYLDESELRQLYPVDGDVRNGPPGSIDAMAELVLATG